MEAGRASPPPSRAQLAWQKTQLGVVFHDDLDLCAGDLCPEDLCAVGRYAEGCCVLSSNRVTPFESTDHFTLDQLDRWYVRHPRPGA